jgi:hypothetical protein
MTSQNLYVEVRDESLALERLAGIWVCRWPGQTESLEACELALGSIPSGADPYFLGIFGHLDLNIFRHLD